MRRETAVGRTRIRQHDRMADNIRRGFSFLMRSDDCGLGAPQGRTELAKGEDPAPRGTCHVGHQKPIVGTLQLGRVGDKPWIVEAVAERGALTRAVLSFCTVRCGHS